MKIALISFHFAEYAYRLGSALAKQHVVLLIMNKENAQRELVKNTYERQDTRLKVMLLPDYGLKNPLMLLNLFKIITEIQKFTPDVIHCQEAVKDYLAAALPFLRRYPLILTIHDHVPHSGRDMHDRRRITLYKHYLRKIADAVIVHGDRIRSESETIFPWLKGRIFSVPHGPLGDEHSPSNNNWEKGTLLFFGRIEKYKGLAYLIEAVKILKRRGTRVRTIIAGTGQDLDTYRNEINADPSFELIDRYIRSEEIPVLFGRANIVVLPYTDATQSGIAALALQYGRPVVATDVGSIREMVREGFNGVLVPPKNSMELAEAINTLVEDQPLAKTLAQNSEKLVKGKLSWTAIADRTVEIYQYATKRRD